MFFNFLISFTVLYLTVSQANGKLFPIAVRLPLNGTPPADGASIWPMPTQLNVERDFMFIDRGTFRIRLATNLNQCEKEIIENLWKHYFNVLFPPKLGYEYPSKNDPRLNTLWFNLKTARNVKATDCQKDYYPNFETNEAEACKNRSGLIAWI
jgi:hypothetical protein